MFQKGKNMGRRGVGVCKKKYDASNYTIEFDNDNVPMGENHARLMSWFGLKCKQHIPYHLDLKDVEDYVFEHLWLQTKEMWNIPNDEAKWVMLKKGKKIWKNFKCMLVREFVNNGITPFEKYPYLEKNYDHWNLFVQKTTSEQYLEKSGKARLSASQNTDPARLGRTGHVGLKDNWRTKWNQLVEGNSLLKTIEDQRSKIWIVSRSTVNKLTGLRELADDMQERINELARTERKMIEEGTYYVYRHDPIIELFGPEHGGRTRTISDVIGSTQIYGGFFKSGSRKQKEKEVPQERTEEASDVSEERVSLQRDPERLEHFRGVDASPSFRGSSCASGGSHNEYCDIEDITVCDLIWPINVAMDLRVARGQVFPISDRILHGRSLNEGFVKVQVDIVLDGYEQLPVPNETQTDEILFMKDTRNQFIQWPRKAIKIFNIVSSRQSMSASDCISPREFQTPSQLQPRDNGKSSSYRPQFKNKLIKEREGYENPEEIIRIPPPGIDKNEWNKYVDFFFEENNKKRGEVNAENMSK